MTLLIIMLAATPLDLSALRTTSRVVIVVKDRYAEPGKVAPKKMLREAVRRWSSDFPEVKADLDRADTIRISFEGTEKTFDLSKIDALWKMSFLMRDIVDVVANKLTRDRDARGMEYSLIHGMLAGLDDPRIHFIEPGQPRPKPTDDLCVFDFVDESALAMPCRR